MATIKAHPQMFVPRTPKELSSSIACVLVGGAPKQIEALARQAVDADQVFVVSGDATLDLPEWWLRVTTLEEAQAACTCTWVALVRDGTPSLDWLKHARQMLYTEDLYNIGVLYTDMLLDDERFSIREFVASPGVITREDDYTTLQALPDSAIWRVAALNNWDSFSKYRDCLSKGWLGKKQNGVFTSSQASRLETHKHCSVGVVTLFSGDLLHLERWVNYLSSEDLPVNTFIYAVDNSNNVNFHAYLAQALSTLSGKVTGWAVLDARDTFEEDPDVGYLHSKRHQHVANLYNKVLPRVTEDLCWFLEDDVEPSVGTIKGLLETMPSDSNIAGVQSPYASRLEPEYVCAARGPNAWIDKPTMREIRNNIIDCDMMGGGCTVYRTALLKRSLPLRVFTDANNIILGWDGNLGLALRQQGYRLLINGNFTSQHHI